MDRTLDMETSRPAAVVPRRGANYWLRSFSLMLIWEIRSLRIVLPLAIVVQIILGAGLVIGFGFLLGDMPTTEALFLATGVTVISMITLGLVLLTVAMQRSQRNSCPPVSGRGIVFLTVAGVVLGMTLWTYNAMRVFVPLLLLTVNM